MRTYGNSFSLVIFATLVAASSANADTITYSYSGGIVTDTISTTGTYLITAAGAQGGNGRFQGQGGLGALLSGDVFLTAGEVLDIAVGGRGLSFNGGGGGGGSFVLAPSAVPLVVAGGGGGGYGVDGQGGQTGVAGSGQGGASGGTCGGGGGAGLNGNGQDGGGGFECGGGSGGGDYANSFTGGAGYNGSNGGFGGGGGAGVETPGTQSGGGGGGYSGGAGGAIFASGYGGTSYFDPSFTNTIATAGTNSGNGYVTITFEPSISEVPEPRYAALMVIFIAGFGLSPLRRRASSSYYNHLRKGIAAGWIAAGLVALACGSAFADTIVQPVTESPSGSNNNITNSDVLGVFSVTPTFNEFNPSLGTLDSATLTWSATGSLTVTGNNEGQAIMSYDTSSDTETWNINSFGGSSTMNFSISGTDDLSLGSVTGTGTFNAGAFAENYQLQQGYFFGNSFSTGPTSGTFTLTYDYTLPVPPPPPGNTVPEVSSVSYFPAGILLFVVALRARARRKHSAQVS
jgi:hypothetical protein